MADSTHIEQQAIIRTLRDFEERLWPAFRKRGFETMGDAFQAYLLMQLVSAQGAQLTKAAITAVPMDIHPAKPRTAAEDFVKEIKRKEAIEGVLVGG